MKINVFDIVLADRTAIEPFTIDIDEDEDVNTAIAEYLDDKYDEVPTFDWEYGDDDVWG